jgi:serine/threonine protein kinase
LIADTSARGERLSRDHILKLARQLCRALVYLHGRGIIHRDVTPQNIWLDERHEAHLGDFDAAVLAEAGGDHHLPITTEGYASPEEREGEPLDFRTDLFSMGGVLIAAATGVLRCRDPYELRLQRPDLPRAFHDLVARLVAHDRNDRPESAERVRQLLERMRHGTDVHSLIEAGEGPHVEFKATFRYPIGLPGDLAPTARQAAIQQHEPKLEKAVLKTIDAFLNTSGGTLSVRLT